MDVFLELFPPDSETPLVLPGKVTFDRSDPPHGQFEWTINPADIVKMLIEPPRSTAKELPEGHWKVASLHREIDGGRQADPKSASTARR